MNAEARIEKTALKLGAQGIFYLNETPATMVKGVKALLSGELWFSRQVTSRLLRQNRFECHCDPAWNDLTPREKEILQQLASGASNQQLADHLCSQPAYGQNPPLQHLQENQRRKPTPGHALDGASLLELIPALPGPFA